MKRIFVLEDDKNISSIIAFNLRAEGYEVLQEFDGKEGLARLEKEGADLLILDLMLPTLGGFEVLRRLRAVSDIPVIILSARTDESDKLEGLSLYADDYMTKPFSVSELLARVKVHLARYNGMNSAHAKYSVKDITVDTKSMSVIKNGENISVSKKEFEILVLLIKNRGTILSREQILEKVWGYDGYLGDLHTVDVAIGRLRAKIESTQGAPEIILSRRGAGYYIQ